MTLVLAIVLWAGLLAFFLILAGGVRRGDDARERALREGGYAGPKPVAPPPAVRPAEPRVLSTRHTSTG